MLFGIVGGLTLFTDAATAGTGNFTNNGGVNRGGGGGSAAAVEFHQNATAGNGTFINNSAMDATSGNGATAFYDSSTAGNGKFTNNSPTVSGAFAAAVEFFDNATAANGSFTNNGGAVAGASGTRVGFDGNHSTAGNGTFISNGGSVAGAGGGGVVFFGTSSAGSATLIANGGIGGGAGATVSFSDESSGGTPRLELFGNGALDISVHEKLLAVVVGSIQGNGQILLGSGNLTTGSNNLSTAFSGLIQDGGFGGGTGGSLTKLGNGKLTLSHANTYTGGTTLNGGTLLVKNTKGSATGTALVQVNNGTLGGTGIIGNAVTVGNGSLSGAILLAGNGAKTPGTLTINSPLTFNQLSTFKCGLKRTTSGTGQVSGVAGAVAALGVTINSGASFTFVDTGTGTLPVGTAFTVINNTSANPIAGTFSNLANGSTFTSNGNTFKVNYSGGTGTISPSRLCSSFPLPQYPQRRRLGMPPIHRGRISTFARNLTRDLGQYTCERSTYGPPITKRGEGQNNQEQIKMNSLTTERQNSIRRSPAWPAFLSVAGILACFAFSPAPKAFGVSPAADGGYAGDNTAEGDEALFSVLSGEFNTAIGFKALYLNTTGSDNTASGFLALENNTGNDNTATGSQALQTNTSGYFNTATGFQALLNNVSGVSNTATGFQALPNNTASNNTATGSQTLFYNTSGYYNTAAGAGALLGNIDGFQNTATGLQALAKNTHGSNNTAEGFEALYNSSGSNNIAVGANSGINLTTGSNNIDIGAPGTAGEANAIRIGKSGTQTKTFVAGIYGKTVASGVGVIVNSNGQFGTVQSSARFKDDIKPMDKVSEAVLKLKAVTFHYKEELDPDKVPQFGLIAEEVEKVNPDLVLRDEDGKVTTVRYEAVNAMLLNEFLKEHGKVEEQERKAQGQEARLAKAEAIIAQQQNQIQALTADLQKVSDQLELDRSTSRLVNNNNR